MDEKKFDFEVWELAEKAEEDPRVLNTLVWALADVVQSREAVLSKTTTYLRLALSELKELEIQEAGQVLHFLEKGIEELESIGYKSNPMDSE